MRFYNPMEEAPRRQLSGEPKFIDTKGVSAAEIAVLKKEWEQVARLPGPAPEIATVEEAQSLDPQAWQALERARCGAISVGLLAWDDPPDAQPWYARLWHWVIRKRPAFEFEKLELLSDSDTSVVSGLRRIINKPHLLGPVLFLVGAVWGAVASVIVLILEIIGTR